MTALDIVVLRTLLLCLIKLNLDYLLMLEMVKGEDGVMGRLEHNNQLGYQFSVLSR